MTEKGSILVKSKLIALSRYVSPAMLAALGVLFITIIALFVPPYIGMADNGDYFRILYSNGLYFNMPNYDSYYLGYFIKEYGIFQHFNENGATLFSSQSYFIRLSIWLNELFYHDQLYDIRFQTIIFIVLYTIAIYLFVESLTWKIPRKYGYPIALIAIFLFADTAYTAFFNSFFSESIVWTMLIYVFAAGLLLYRNRYNDYVLMAIFFVSALLLTTSKQQNAPVGVILAVTGLVLIFVRKERAYRIGMSAILVALFLAGVGTYVLIPKEFVNINQYHAMTRGVLMESEDPEATLKAFGIDKQYAVLNKSIYYEPYTTVDVDSKILEDHFYSKYGFGSILAYYITNPGQAFKMLDIAAKHAFTIRPPAMGNYEKSAGKEFAAQTSFFSVYSKIKHALAPKTFGFIVLWVIIIIGLYMPSFIKAVKDKHMRHIQRLPLILGIMLLGLSGILVSIIGAGDADLSKHEFLFTAAFDLVTFVAIADAIRGYLWRSDQDIIVQ
ncbi:hypothetical protein [Paenibacillus arenosi]|uniref:Transmembrane protein n=1 Tax=Paenibacillus arenosi TaxID=2774142 RepID=A0ABR9AYS1_9BACL|nr:hypothetical protein [Paenibacillus arenosi]MBD8499303.1 hypothetical protein [Paenibacillus arenosi]